MRPTLLAAAVLLAGCAAPVAPPASPESGTGFVWVQHADGPTPRTEVAAVALEDVIAVVGGFDAAGTNVATVELYDPAADAWSRGPDFPLPIHHTALVAHEGTAYAFGGFTGAAFIPTNAVFRWSPGEPLWRPVATLPAPRAAHAAALVNDTVVLVGGFTLGMALLPQVDLYDLAAGTWSRGPDLPTPRDHLGAAALGGLVYAVGGEEGGHDANVADVHAWTPGAEAWQDALPLPRPRGSLQAGALGERILAVGGQDLQETFADADAFAPGRGWTALPAMPTARHGLGLAVWGDRAWALLGGPEPGQSVTGAVESFGPALPGR